MGWLLVGLAFAQAPEAGPAQEAAQALGILRVTVRDEEMDLSIPGALVALSGEALIGGVQERLSDQSGEALFSEIPPGVYQVVVSKEGFGGTTMEGIQVQPERTTAQTVTLYPYEDGG